jgi:hypothetical protein
MADTLGGVKAIDLERSDVDEGRSNPEKGIYFFNGEPTVISDKSYKDAGTCPPYVFEWVSKEMGGGRRLKHYLYNLHFDFVQNIEDPYFPQGADLDGDGHWTYGDMVWMKCPLELHMERKVKQVRAQDDASKAIHKQFAQNIGKDSKGSVMSEDELAVALERK